MDKLYSQVVLSQAARILGLQDRNPLSPTYGCFDRNYWHYHVTNIAGARWQEAGLILALLYQNNFPGNYYYHQTQIKNWALAAVKFWSQIQASDGSVSEWYPHEHSFVATAFSLYAVTEIWLILKPHQPRLITNFKRAGDWLINHQELQVTNQQAGAALALYNLFLLTGQKKYRTACFNKITQLAQEQTSEGWIREYGGADIGYTSVLIDYLAKLYDKSGDQRVWNIVQPACQFLLDWVHPDFTYGGEYGSRNTEYLLPHGFEILARRLPAARSLSQLIKTNLGLYPLNLDDRYLCYNGYTWLQASLASHMQTAKAQSITKSKTTQLKILPQAGLFRYQSPTYLAYGNYLKGTAIKIFNSKTRTLIYQTAGLIGQTTTGQIVANQQLSSLHQFTRKSDHQLQVSGPFFYVNYFPQSLLLSQLFTLWQLSFGRWRYLALLSKNLLRRLLIRHHRPAPINYQQEIHFGHRRVTLITTIALNQPQLNLSSLYLAQKFATIYVPSSRYFHLQELNSPASQLTSSQLKKLNRRRQLTVTKTISPI